MTKANETDDDNCRLGRRMIDTALKMEDNLAELMAIQVIHMKHLSANELREEMAGASTTLRNIIFSLILTDERILRGLELCGIITHKSQKPSWLATDDRPD